MELPKYPDNQIIEYMDSQRPKIPKLEREKDGYLDILPFPSTLLYIIVIP